MDKDLIKVWNMFREGDKHAFSILFEMYLQPLYRYGMKFVSDEAFVKDCIQDLFVKMYNNRASLSATSNPKFYLLLSLKNIIIDALAKNSRLVYLPPEELPFIANQYVAGHDETDNEEEIKEKFEQALSGLSPRQKEAIYLRFQMDLSYEEISQLLGVNYQSVRNLIHRAISKIRENINLTLFISLFIKTFSHFFMSNSR